MNIAIIGPRGVGKSKTSRKLSKLVSYPVVSTDMIAVYELNGMSIPEYIAQEKGKWQNFRKLEYKIIEKLSKSKNLILDCGGGILFDVDSKGNEVYSEKKYNLLKSFCAIIGLCMKTEVLVNKVKGDALRPNLNQAIAYEEILKKRLPYYKISADHYLKIDGLDSEIVAKQIKSLLNL